MGGFGGWFRRRVVRADLRDRDLLCASGRYHWSDYLEDRPGWRRYWMSAGLFEGAVFAVVVVSMLGFPWIRPAGDGPRLGWWLVTVPVAAVGAWMLLLVQSSLRGMLRGLHDPVRPAD
ncbi:hypothetical protein [Phycicoccus flavus]|uniref:Uncharacterized protein n=1 Tax=Phycicoccus flavus TaxID=2502783 RepID=A0A8T6R4Y5_9MICO|nr:hypothetical protein [Phycicoccus flavus]NHA67875.1 hypothetical protein [Phycicoccus flavus]